MLRAADNHGFFCVEGPFRLPFGFLTCLAFSFAFCLALNIVMSIVIVSSSFNNSR